MPQNQYQPYEKYIVYRWLLIFLRHSSQWIAHTQNQHPDGPNRIDFGPTLHEMRVGQNQQLSVNSDHPSTDWYNLKQNKSGQICMDTDYTQFGYSDCTTTSWVNFGDPSTMVFGNIDWANRKDVYGLFLRDGDFSGYGGCHYAFE